MAENRTATPTPESAVGAFGIQPDGEDINFHWDVLVFRAVQGM